MFINVIADLDWTCEMLQCGTHLLKDALTKRTVEAGNERMTTPLTAAQVCVLHLHILNNYWMRFL